MIANLVKINYVESLRFDFEDKTPDISWVLFDISSPLLHSALLINIHLSIYYFELLYILQAKDSDAGNNSRISYELIQTKDSDEFSIDRETGWIQAKSSYAGKFGEEFVINVIAKDNFGEEPYFNDTAEVKVGLYDIHIIFY